MLPVPRPEPRKLFLVAAVVRLEDREPQLFEIVCAQPALELARVDTHRAPRLAEPVGHQLARCNQA